MNTEMMESKLETVHPDDHAQARFILDDMEGLNIEAISDCVAAVRDYEQCVSHEDVAMVCYTYNYKRSEVENVYMVARYSRELAQMVMEDPEIDVFAAAYKLSLN